MHHTEFQTVGLVTAKAWRLKV